MGRWFAAAVCLVMATGACASGEGGIDDSGFENVGDDSADNVIGDIEWRLRDVPEALELGVAKHDAVGFGQCESVEPDDEDTDIQINCGNAWAEVAWYVVPADQVAVGQTLRATMGDLDEANRVRASIHEVDAGGEKRKLATHPMLFAADSVEATVESQLDHYIYVARGRSLTPLWGTGSIAYSVTATME